MAGGRGLKLLAKLLELGPFFFQLEQRLAQQGGGVEILVGELAPGFKQARQRRGG